MHPISEQKFSTFSEDTQHTHLAKKLRLYYETKDLSQLHTYNKWQSWIGCQPLDPSSSHKAVADRFHWHLSKTHYNLREHSLLPNITKEDKTKACTPWPIAIYLDNIRSAHNVGSIIRTCEAFSLGTLHFSEMTPFIDHSQVKSAAMQAEQWVSCNNHSQIEALPRPIIALETSEQALSLYDFIFPESFSLILGNEEYGCSDQALSTADYIVHIPLRGRKNSLNVANAFAIVASEIQRGRQ